MIKKNISLLLIWLAILTAVIPAYAYGSEKVPSEHPDGKAVQAWIINNYIKGYIKILDRELSESNPADLTVSEAGAVIKNKAVRNLHITKDVGDGNVTLKNVKIEGELLIEGGGQNSIIIENSSVNKLTANKESGKVRILLEGNTTVESAFVKSDTILEQKQLEGMSLEKITLNVNSSVELKADKKTTLSSSIEEVAEVKPDGTVTAKKTGVSVISAVIKGRKTDICEITVIDPPIKTIKILAIGNSFSQDALYYLHDIANSAGINIIAGNLYSSGCSLERHYKYASGNERAYDYYKWTSAGMTEEKNMTMKDAVLDEDWDYITFQQSSGDSGIYSTYQPYLNNLIAYVNGIASNPDVKLALSMTWAYSSRSANENFAHYNRDQRIMYDAVINAYKQAVYDTGIDILIPCGTSIQNARTNKYLRAVGNELTSDGYHLNEGIGRYIAGLTLFESIIKEENISKDLYEDVKFIPETIETTEDLAYSAKKAVENAVAKPFEITTEISR